LFLAALVLAWLLLILLLLALAGAFVLLRLRRIFGVQIVLSGLF